MIRRLPRDYGLLSSAMKATSSFASHRSRRNRRRCRRRRRRRCRRANRRWWSCLRAGGVVGGRISLHRSIADSPNLSVCSHLSTRAMVKVLLRRAAAAAAAAAAADIALPP